MSDSPDPAPWHVYMIEADDGSLYTGVATDVERRFREHAGGGPRAARYFRGRRPLRVIYVEAAADRSSALRREAAIKTLSKSQKWALVAGFASDLRKRKG